MNQVVVKVRREMIEACMTCSICTKLLKDATTISECLHTFCRKCIFELINEEDLDRCPVCNINLGGAPMDKLRPDHCLQDLQARLFPSKKTKAKVTESVASPLPSPSVPVTTRRKERSLASLAINTPIIEARVSSSTGKGKKSSQRKGFASREFSFQSEEDITPYRDHADCSGSFENTDDIAQSIVKDTKNMTIGEYSSQYAPGRGKNSFEPHQLNAKTWERSKSPKDETSQAVYSSLNSTVKFAPPQFQYGKPCVFNTKLKETDENATAEVPQSSVKPKKPRGSRKKRATPAEVQTVEETRRECDEQGGGCSFWFSLVASTQQKVFPPLAQIPRRYLRITDGTIPVSLIKKYLVNKLGLIREDEVEITLRGHSLPGAWQMRHLLDMWSDAAPTSQRMQTTVGSSAKDVVMVLYYGRKVQVS